MTRSLLIGGPHHNPEGLKGWITFGFKYRALVPRFTAALAVFLLLAALLYAPLDRVPASSLHWMLPTLGYLVQLAKAFALLFLAGYASLLSLRLVIDILRFRGFGRVTAAMALPLCVMVVATYLLFFNDQGRELSLGLIDYSIGEFALLFLVLIYWAGNAWLSARVGLNRAFPEPQHHQILLFWGPRFVGVIAHYLAACSLSFAALKETTPPDLVSNVVVVLAAPCAVLLAILLVWFLEHGLLPHRGSAEQRTRAFFHALLVVFGSAVWLTIIPAALVRATLAISLSVFVFLSLISWLRSRPPLGSGASRERRQLDTLAEAQASRICGLGFAAIMAIGTAAIWINPMWVGRQLGSLVIAFFAFGSFLSGANLLDLTADALARECTRRGLISVRRETVWCFFVGLLVMPAVLMSATRTYHSVRLCRQCEPATSEQRPDVKAAVKAWYQQAEPIYHSLHPKEEPVPLFIIATAGGGIRAAYWTATVLETLEADLDNDAVKNAIAAKMGHPGNDGLLRHLLFAISGVSGGSVGAAAYTAAVQNHLVHSDAEIKPTTYFKGDLLAPGLASLAFIDIPSNFLPDFGQIERGAALERGFENASNGLLSQPFNSFFPQITPAQNPLKWRPALLLNATHQESGRRVITSHLKVDKDTFVDSYDAISMLGSDIRLSTAAHNSARFTYISPAGDLIDRDGNPHGFVIDGGYFENYGAQTAVELARKAKAVMGASIRIVILQISSDPTMVVDNTFRQPCADHSGEFLVSYKARRHWWDLSLFNELSAPMIGIMSVREAHGVAAVSGLAHLCCENSSKGELDIGDTVALHSAAERSKFFHLAMCEGQKSIKPPLGWVLSDKTRGGFEHLLNPKDNDCDNSTQYDKLVEALGRPASLGASSKVATASP
ncbi:hypothetical protein MA20_21290 [Bradyrhizobium japonicum]|uniref:PNPLA domain-containing protein n=2 Tax=Bradyrhizobium japonicum TaxID=375 RepID=A0A0A3XRY2_BRAJP|nr:hypothetical protein MA20_21290 [Bradyrhizobium japonicum]